MRKVFVVMGNDYPDAVFDTEAAAEAYCAKQRPHNDRIYWRVYEFEVQS